MFRHHTSTHMAPQVNSSEPSTGITPDLPNPVPEPRNSSTQLYALEFPPTLCNHHRLRLVIGCLGLVTFNSGPGYDMQVSLPIRDDDGSVLQFVRVVKIDPELPVLSSEQVRSVMAAAYDIPLFRQ
jgi:hypothetical protein